ncbi:MAG: tRNA (N(6)-L-threonylcarbamoyladenosine(37)-C(2))-methylthiotransferase MtaB [Ruminococcaceae bacterium]|nr:tRNA (N(6)-L-threonylcarbamoyladenosine(37)-C(2))-methylthiotransferase MtaB [Oscillospiraceae bacterium]
MKKIGMLTLGCRVNQYESDAIAQLIEEKGYKICPFEKGCDLYIINTCTVTHESDTKCRKAIRRALRYREETLSPVAVIGCFPQGAKDELFELEKVDYLSGNTNKGKIADYIEPLLQGEKFNFLSSLAGAKYENLSISSRKYVKAYVKIEDGCNNFCSYCYVPYVRGRVRSRDEKEIINEVKRLKNSGYREIILTGIETSAYGEDKKSEEPLIELVENIQKECHIPRLRFGSLNPSFFTRKRLERLSKIEGIMPHFHLSVQSASDKVLFDMKRQYTSKVLYEAVENIREFFPTANLSCDMICGFPGEREEDFEQSLEFIRKARILHTHVFPYSIRHGTRAATFPDQISEFVKHNRARIMGDVARETHKKIFEENVAKEYEVLLEFFKDGRTLGYTENFINLSIPRLETHKKGDIIKVKIEEGMDRE